MQTNNGDTNPELQLDSMTLKTTFNRACSVVIMTFTCSQTQTLPGSVTFLQVESLKEP